MYDLRTYLLTFAFIAAGLLLAPEAEAQDWCAKCSSDACECMLTDLSGSLECYTEGCACLTAGDCTGTVTLRFDGTLQFAAHDSGQEPATEVLTTSDGTELVVDACSKYIIERSHTTERAAEIRDHSRTIIIDD